MTWRSSKVRGPGLLEDGVGHLCLADVVDEGGIGDLVGLLLVEAEAEGEGAGVVLDVLEVEAGIGVAGLDDQGEHLQRLAGLVLQVRATLSELRREGERDEAGEDEEHQAGGELVAEVGAAVVEAERDADEEAGPEGGEEQGTDGAVVEAVGDDEADVDEPEVGLVAGLAHVPEHPERRAEDGEIVEDEAGGAEQVHTLAGDEVGEHEVVCDGGGARDDDAAGAGQVAGDEDGDDDAEGDGGPDEEEVALVGQGAASEEGIDAAAEAGREGTFRTEAHGGPEGSVVRSGLHDPHGRMVGLGEGKLMEGGGAGTCLTAFRSGS